MRAYVISAAVTLGATVFYLVAVPVLIETLSRGRSLGKLALGLIAGNGDLGLAIGAAENLVHDVIFQAYDFGKVVFCKQSHEILELRGNRK